MSSETRWIRVTQCENIPLREGRAVEIAGKELAIFNLGERFLAIENRCPHRGGPLADGIVSGNLVVCPLHSWKVCLDDGAVVKPAEERACVSSYRTRVEDGVVCVQIPAEEHDAPALVSSGNLGGDAE
jgi:nitrite reductase (NADH) small subunit